MTSLAHADQHPLTQPLRLGIAGLGTVGGGVAQMVQDRQHQQTGQLRPLDIIAVSARNKQQDRGFSTDGMIWADNPLELASHPDIDVVVELIGGSEGIAKELCEAALRAGKHVVTANKALIAHHGAMLSELTEASGANLLYEAAVAGGIPVIKLMKEGLRANHIQRIIGILNGTCNYILSTMERTGRQFDDVLTEAQELGYAEADPTFDIDGIDAAHKLAILSALAFATKPAIDHISPQGIRHISASDIRSATALGYKIRLIGVTQQSDHGIELRVHPALVPQESQIAKVDGVYNAVQLFGDAVGDVFIQGQGAGRGATASAVMADILDLAAGATSYPFMVPANMLRTASLQPAEHHHGAYYMRIEVIDHSGVLASLTQIFAEYHISVSRFMQTDEAHYPTQLGDARQATITLTTHETTEQAMRDALADIAKLDSVTAPPCMIPIESIS